MEISGWTVWTTWYDNRPRHLIYGGQVAKYSRLKYSKMCLISSWLEWIFQVKNWRAPKTSYHLNSRPNIEFRRIEAISLYCGCSSPCSTSSHHKLSGHDCPGWAGMVSSYISACLSAQREKMLNRNSSQVSTQHSGQNYVGLTGKLKHKGMNTFSYIRGWKIDRLGF